MSYCPVNLTIKHPYFEGLPAGVRASLPAAGEAADRAGSGRLRKPAGAGGEWGSETRNFDVDEIQGVLAWGEAVTSLAPSLLAQMPPSSQPTMAAFLIPSQDMANATRTSTLMRSASKTGRFPCS